MNKHSSNMKEVFEIVAVTGMAAVTIMSIASSVKASADSAELMALNAAITEQSEFKDQQLSNLQKQVKRLENEIEGDKMSVSLDISDDDEDDDEIEEHIEDEIEEQIYENIQKEIYAIEVTWSKERLPEGLETNLFYCEDYRGFDPVSQQAMLQSVCQTEQETGLRYYEYEGTRYYPAALGTAYGITIGDAWEVTLVNGTTFGLVLGDFKHDITKLDPNDFGDQYDLYGNQIQNYDEEDSICVIEFVYDKLAAQRAMIRSGTMTYYDKFGSLYGDGGNIVRMKYIGRIWEP